MRALRFLSAVLSDLRAVGRGDGFAARADLFDEERTRGPRADDGWIRAPLRRMPRLHGLRDGVPVRRAVRAAHRGHARANRAAPRSVAHRSSLPPRDLFDLSVSAASAPRPCAMYARAIRGVALSRPPKWRA